MLKYLDTRKKQITRLSFNVSFLRKIAKFVYPWLIACRNSSIAYLWRHMGDVSLGFCSGIRILTVQNFKINVFLYFIPGIGIPHSQNNFCILLFYCNNVTYSPVPNGRGIVIAGVGS